MKRLRLTGQVLLEGPDYFGRKASIRFTPAPANVTGWYWKLPNETGFVPINLEYTKYTHRKLSLVHGSMMLHVIEHVTPLRMTGLDGIYVESDSWPPFHGRTLELWEALREHCVPTGEEVSWCTVKHTTSANYPKNPERETVVSPSSDLSVEMLVSIYYKNIGGTNLCVKLPNNLEDAEMYFGAKSQGIPKWLYYPSRYIPRWMFPHRPYHDSITWPQEAGERTITEFATHRVLDILGALMLLDHQRLPSVRVHSKRSGHFADICALRKVATVPLEK